MTVVEVEAVVVVVVVVVVVDVADVVFVVVVVSFFAKASRPVTTSVLRADPDVRICRPYVLAIAHRHHHRHHSHRHDHHLIHVCIGILVIKT